MCDECEDGEEDEDDEDDEEEDYTNVVQGTTESLLNKLEETLVGAGDRETLQVKFQWSNIVFLFFGLNARQLFFQEW